MLSVVIFTGAIGSNLCPLLISKFRGSSETQVFIVVSLMFVWAASCITLGLTSSTEGALVSLVFYGIGTGSMPAVLAQLSEESPSDKQGLVQGFIIALGDLANVLGGFAYFFFFESFVNDDEFEFENITHVECTNSSLIWWISAGGLIAGAAVLAVSILPAKPVSKHEKMDSPENDGIVGDTERETEFSVLNNTT